MTGQTAARFPSLAQHLEAPPDFRAVFGWMCGYSADAAFLDDALERFTRQTKAQRAYNARVWLALMLDPSNPLIPFTDAPGSAHLPFREDAARPFALQHAKVALLGFRGTEDPVRWRIRLLVSTGNWTRQTLEESLDLAWCIEVDSTDLAESIQPIATHCADIKAAHSLLAWLASRCDTRLLQGTVGRMIETVRDREDLERWLARCAKTAGQAAARFFDNRQRSLLAQLAERVMATSNGKAVRRNYLAMGSGFYEAPVATGTRPTVPIKIRDHLRAAGLLTQKADIDLFVNPLECQAIAGAVTELAAEGLYVRSAAAPAAVYGENALRTLHAKFIFSANHRENSDYCGSPWLYLGSGNLTKPGFCLAAEAGGNLEAGVLFVPNAVAWKVADGIPQHDVVTNLLPIQWEQHYSGGEALKPGEGFPERPEAYFACPVAWLAWQDAAEGGELVAPEPTDPCFEVLDAIRGPCPRADARFRWSGARPREVVIRWSAADGISRECPVPVVDELGRIAGTPLPALDLTDAWWQLADFPLPPASAGEEPGEDDDANNGPQNGTDSPVGSGAARPCLYPIRQMMEFVENIAAKQCTISEPDWHAWCARLEQTLRQAGGTPVIAAFVALGLNPLSPLRAAPFHPHFAESTATGPGKDYEALLDRIETIWGIVGLTPIGG